MIIGNPRNTVDVEAICRTLFYVTGTCYSPKVFDVTDVEFDRIADLSVVELTLTSRCHACKRRCRVTSAFGAIDHRTSDEFI